jgi:hypothetical protein
MGDFLEKLGIKKVNPAFETTHGIGRSIMLMPPGDPRLIDAFNPNDLATDAKNLAKEIIYVAGMNKTASLAEQQTLKAFSRDQGLDLLTSDQLLAQQKADVQTTTDDTARLKGEPVYEKKIYCHVEGERQGFFTRQEKTIDINGIGSKAFEKTNDADQCHKERDGDCIDRHPVYRNCRRRESIFYISLEKWEIVRYQHVQNPKQYVVDSLPCRHSEHKDKNTHNRHDRCSERLRVVGQEITKRDATLPDQNDPRKTMGDSHDAGKHAALAARVGTWVGAELARARYEELSGRSLLPGKNRIYTIYESIKCEPKTQDGRDIFKKKIPGGWVWSSCQDAVKLEVRKYFQQRLLRRACDKIFNYKLGAPFK